MNAFRAVLVVLLLLLAEGKAIAQETTETKPKVHGNVFGGGNNAVVKVNTTVTMSYGTVEGNVYGGGNVGSIGTFTVSEDMRTFTWTDVDGNPNTPANANNKNTGVCNVTITNGTVKGNVFGAGKGKDDTFWCEKAIAYSTNVNVSGGTLNRNVYGGGEVGRVETNTVVKLGNGAGTEEITRAPSITGSVFGGGAGVETHGYSALVRGDTHVTVEGNAGVGRSVYGGGEIASVGKYGLDNKNMPSILKGGGYCYVTVQGHARVGSDVFGAGEGVKSHFNQNSGEKSTWSKRMVTYAPAREKNPHTDGNKGTLWWPYNEAEETPVFVWEYFPDDSEESGASKYATYLETLALSTHPEVTINGNASVNGSVYGGGELGITKGSVIVNIQGGTIAKDVYGGGSLANTNTTTKADLDDDGNEEDIAPTTTVNLTGGAIHGNAYGGGLGQLGVNASAAVYYTEEEATAYNTEHGLSEGNEGYVTTETVKTPAVAGADAIPATVFGDINVNLGSEGGTTATAFYLTNYDAPHADVVKSGRVFGCNNLYGSPQGNVTVTVYKTVEGNSGRTVENSEGSGVANKTNDVDHTYQVAAVYGGGNLADYIPASEGKKASVKIMTCDVSIREVYGGGNAAAVPETDVLINGAYEIETVFGGGNGKDPYTLDGGSNWIDNSGANVGKTIAGDPIGSGNTTTLLKGGYIHEAYGGSNKRGSISGTVRINSGSGGDCTLDCKKIVAAGKNADLDGDAILIMGCVDGEKIDQVIGGADDANVNGKVELTITSGEFGKIFGGNNLGGIIKGSITVNIQETSCTPIKIDELYLGGNEAAYSVYGYKEVTDQTTGKKKLVGRSSLTDGTLAYEEPANHPEGQLYADPVLNVISCTSIGQVFGGGLGSGAAMYASPTVNINMIPGALATSAHALGEIGDVFGGGNKATVYGNTTVNIGTKTTVDIVKPKVDGSGNPLYEEDGVTYQWETVNNVPVEGANITGNVYGGGNLANVGDYNLVTLSDGSKNEEIDVVGNTFVNICAIRGSEILDSEDKPTGRYTYNSVKLTAENAPGVTIAGNVYGGGNGEAADEVEGSFRCGKAMVTGGTNVAIGNGTVGTTLSNGTLKPETGTVYGGGAIGRVEGNTAVTIGIGEGTADGTASAPVIMGDVYGAGAGEKTHGYAALVRGDAHVTIEGNAKVGQSVYGGGEIASVGRYNVAQTDAQLAEAIAAGYDVEKGMPYALRDSESGKCYVTVQGYAEIGPDDMQMTAEGGPDDTGYVFGAGKGILPYDGVGAEGPRRMHPTDKWESYTDEGKYLKYIETLALATKTYVTIDQHAFIKGSVYGGSENGHVQHDTYVYIKGGQIGNGWDKTKNSGVNERYADADFINPATATAEQIIAAAGKLHECASWEYKSPYKPYDKYVNSADGATTATDGHTFYGNVFGGGSGLYPYKRPNGTYEWLRSAGRVYGNTNVEITGGHILTSVYGGCELTDVGNGKSVETDKGKCFVKMSGGTLGVPRTLDQIAAHPVTCYLFGAGKGDQRARFNQWTNVGSVDVQVSGGIIYGSVFGGGEDGHVLGNVQMSISEADANKPTVIGTWGTSYVEGNVFGGGRGFGGDALTAGVVCGDVDINITGGNMLGSIYGGGRLGSVGTYLVPPTVKGTTTAHPKYGTLIPDGNKVTIDETNGTVTEETGGGTHGHITIAISGGTIGNNYEYILVPLNTTESGLATLKNNSYIPNTEFEPFKDTNQQDAFRQSHTKGGNVFAGSMGRLYGLDGSTKLENWPDLGKARKTTLTISGTAKIKSNVYGGGELGTVDEGTVININGGTIGTAITDASDKVVYTFGSVFGSGYGSESNETGTYTGSTTAVIAKEHAGLVLGSTDVNMTDGTVEGSIYGGGEMATVAVDTDIDISGGSVGYPNMGGVTMGNVFGGGKGTVNTVRAGLVKGNTKVKISQASGKTTRIYHNIYGGGAYGSVGTFDYEIDNTNKVKAIKSCTSGGTAEVTITGGTIGVDGHENGMVFGSSRGDVGAPGERHDLLAWVNDTKVMIGDENNGTTKGGTGKVYNDLQIKGSVYGSGENGHTYHNATVTMHSGTIGITDKTIDGGPRYAYRGNLYGGGCGTDTYTVDGKKYFNPLAGVVYGNVTLTIDGGHVVRNVYGGGAMGSVGDFTFADGKGDDPAGKPISCKNGTGTCNITISGGMVGNPGAQMTASGGPDSYGLVFGAGRGDALDPLVYPNINESGYVNHTYVTITNEAFVTASVFGGSQSGHVLGNTSVTIAGGQIGCGEGETEPYADSDWNKEYLAECAHWPYQDNGATYDKYYGTDGYDAKGGHIVGTDGHTFYGNVFGGGSGYSPYAAGKWLRKAGMVEGSSSLTITGGHILSSAYGGNERSDVVGSCTVVMSGGTIGVPLTDAQKQAHPIAGNLFGAGKGDKRVLFNTWTNVGSTSVTVTGGKIYGSVFGGGEDGHVRGNVETTISNASVVIGTHGTSGFDGNVFGGGRGSVTALTAGVVGGNATLNIEDGEIMGSVYGGGRLASVGTFFAEADDESYGKMQSGDHGKLIVNISGGTIHRDVFGGCKGTEDNEMKDKLGLAKSTIVNLMGGTVSGSLYGGGEVGNVGDRADGESSSNAFAKINLLGGTVNHVYGGGLGMIDKDQDIDAKALVKGDVTVNLNGLEIGDYVEAIHGSVVTGLDESGDNVADFYRVGNRANGCKVTGNIFGCNNVNGTPEGHAKVHVFMTTPKTDQLDTDYDVAAVFGGGNQADYVPTDETQSTEVIIEGCDLTKILEVYGGGNAAATPGTHVIIKGTQLIDNVFGGGNGKGEGNPGANVGYHTDKSAYSLGQGKVLVELMAGNINNAYGGSNTLGDIRGGASITKPTPPWSEGVTSCCQNLKVDNIYGGGKEAEMSSGANIIMGCTDSQDWVNEIYPGSEAADIGGDVTITITSGKFGRVFGGNNKSGKLNGSITINIEENGACGVPVIIGEIYGGGNKAPYSIYGYDSNGNMLTSGTRQHADPQINVRAFTSIGNIYGGGYGESAVMYGSPTVSINEVNSNRTTGSTISTAILKKFEEETENEYTVEIPTHDDGEIGAVNNVFGGGNAARVEGNTTVNVGTTEYEYLLVTDALVVGTTDVSAYYTRAGAGTTASPFVYTKAAENAKAEEGKTYYKRMTVVGADIRGNVYGGGNEAEVTGNTNVNIGKPASTTSTPTP